ncbi:hypothetical protein D3C81_823030 [compost metagenome]
MGPEHLIHPQQREREHADTLADTRYPPRYLALGHFPRPARLHQRAGRTRPGGGHRPWGYAAHQQQSWRTCYRHRSAQRQWPVAQPVPRLQRGPPRRGTEQRPAGRAVATGRRAGGQPPVPGPRGLDHPQRGDQPQRLADRRPTGDLRPPGRLHPGQPERHHPQWRELHQHHPCRFPGRHTGAAGRTAQTPQHPQCQWHPASAHRRPAQCRGRAGPDRAEARQQGRALGQWRSHRDRWPQPHASQRRAGHRASAGHAFQHRRQPVRRHARRAHSCGQHCRGCGCAGRAGADQGRPGHHPSICRRAAGQRPCRSAWRTDHRPRRIATHCRR